jgi:hypothetical protein
MRIVRQSKTKRQNGSKGAVAKQHDPDTNPPRKKQETKKHCACCVIGGNQTCPTTSAQESSWAINNMRQRVMLVQTMLTQQSSHEC